MLIYLSIFTFKFVEKLKENGNFLSVKKKVWLCFFTYEKKISSMKKSMQFTHNHTFFATKNSPNFKSTMVHFRILHWSLRPNSFLCILSANRVFVAWDRKFLDECNIEFCLFFYYFITKTTY